MTVAQIRFWNKRQGLSDIGYHYVIHLVGTVEEGRPWERAGAHCRGYNATSIGICYVGGLDKNGKPKDSRTQAQKTVILNLVTKLRARFSIPKSRINGHNEFANKACPCFDVRKEF